MMKLGLLFLAGGAGTIMRYAVSGLTYQALGTRFPYGTLVVNLSGCFLIGLLTALAEEKLMLSTGVRLFLLIGFLGAFTTFSTFVHETAVLIKGGQVVLAFANMSLSVIMGFFVFYLGVLAAEMI